MCIDQFVPIINDWSFVDTCASCLRLVANPVLAYGRKTLLGTLYGDQLVRHGHSALYIFAWK